MPNLKFATAVSILVAVAATTSPTLAAPPGETRNLFVSPRAESVHWDPVVGAGVYHVYRGDRLSVSELATTVEDSCRLGSFEVTETGPILDTQTPLDDYHFYLVRGENVDGEGTVGSGRSHEPWGGCCGETAFADRFTAADGSTWHPRWTRTFDVDVADIQSGAGRFRPVVSTYSLARLYSYAELRDVDATFRVRFENLARQGVGFYVRSNGGYLTATPTPGQGYAVFIEGFRPGGNGIGIWKEIAGDEIEISVNYDPGPGLVMTDGVDYRVRFRVVQIDPTSTQLQARIWEDGQPEGTDWDVDLIDTSATSPELQGIAGGIAVDSWSNINPSTPGSPTPMFTFLDDIRVTRLCDPLDGAIGPEVLGESFLFTEGPLWHDGAVVFSDIQADTIYEYRGAGPATTFRSPSGRSNGLGHHVNGDLLACEHDNRRVSRTDSLGAVTSLVDNYLGMRFNSPNDIAVRGDGTVYFTDPAYGLAVPTDREIPFNGLFRLATNGTLVAEWEGDAATTGPNGVVLSPDERRLYMSDSELGEVVVYDVAADGSLANRQTFATGLAISDGMCIDMAGNLFVSTFPGSLEVFWPDGAYWGSLPVPRTAANCAFGGDDRLSLYITARQGLYRYTMAGPGLVR